MADRFLFLLDAKARFRLAYDAQQWIIQRRVGSPRPGEGPAMRDTGWKAVSFIGGELRVLQRCLREAGVRLTPVAQAHLDALPEQFLDFIANPNSYTIRAAA